MRCVYQDGISGSAHMYGKASDWILHFESQSPHPSPSTPLEPDLILHQIVSMVTSSADQAETDPLLFILVIILRFLIN